jgi:hypothetical protein
MTKETVKSVVDDTQKSYQESKQQVVKEKIKSIVLEYLKRIDDLDSKIDELQAEKKQLKLTLDDLKSGKLDVLAERLEKDPVAKQVNIIKIHETHIHHHDHYNPYHTPFVINYPVYPTAPLNPITPWINPAIYCVGAVAGIGLAVGGGGCSATDAQFTATGFDCKTASVGSYSVGDSVVNFR